MTRLRILLMRIVGLSSRARRDDEFDDEVQAHLDLLAAEHERRGLSPEEAHLAARRDFGGVAALKDGMRAGRGLPWLEDIARDIRFATRMLGRRPGFTVAAVIILALGIGANTAVFSVIDALELQSLPVPDPQELVQVTFQSARTTGDPAERFSYALVRGLDGQRGILAGVAGFGGGTNFDVGPPGAVHRMPGVMVTGAYYETLGIQPALGRVLGDADDEIGAPPVAVISDAYWARAFGRSPAAVGQRLLVNGVPVTIVGVGPSGFSGVEIGATADITMAVAALPAINREAAVLLEPGNFWLSTIARLRPGIPRAAAEAQLSAIWPRIAESSLAPTWPVRRREAIAHGTLHLAPGRTGALPFRGMLVGPLTILMAIVALVLLVACANVGGLLLARASARQKEIAVRLALGAGRARLVRQLLIESMVLVAAGAVGGVALAWSGSRGLVNLTSAWTSPLTLDLTPNWHIVGFTAAVAVACVAIFGVAPALHATAIGPLRTLKEESGTLAASRSRLLPALVVVQVALTLVLLIGAGLFVRTLTNLEGVELGFNADRVLLVDLEAHEAVSSEHVIDELATLPGVMSASVSTHTPLSGALWSEPAVPAGQSLPDEDTALFVGASPGFFTTMGIALRSGRAFTATDSASAPPVAVVSEAYAARYFPHEAAVGQRLSVKIHGRPTELLVVGVAGDTRSVSLRVQPRATVYVPYAQVVSGDAPVYPTIEIRAAGEAATIAAAVERVLRTQMPNDVIAVRPLSVQVENRMARERVVATVATLFGWLALVLACVGLYGLMAYHVATRVKEIGIRTALGADRARIVGEVLGRSVRLAVLGLAFGLPLALAASRSVQSILFGVTPGDAQSVAAAVVLLALTSVVASWMPARRAALVDPVEALRHD